MGEKRKERRQVSKQGEKDKDKKQRRVSQKPH